MEVVRSNVSRDEDFEGGYIRRLAVPSLFGAHASELSYTPYQLWPFVTIPMTWSRRNLCE